jgi:hypothetical protein
MQTVHHSAMRFGSEHCSTVQRIMVRSVLYNPHIIKEHSNTKRHNYPTKQYTTFQRMTLQNISSHYESVKCTLIHHNTTQHNTTHNITQHITLHHSTYSTVRAALTWTWLGLRRESSLACFWNSTADSTSILGILREEERGKREKVEGKSGKEEKKDRLVEEKADQYTRQLLSVKSVLILNTVLYSVLQSMQDRDEI